MMAAAKAKKTEAEKTRTDKALEGKYINDQTAEDKENQAQFYETFKQKADEKYEELQNGKEPTKKVDPADEEILKSDLQERSDKYVELYKD